ncbi:MAG: Hsp20/alpha crystallin family protein [Ignavibacteriales bacterium]|nr:Hsp20/alpha crystallin family protein [Ignavibacteriales bacterium]
MSEKNNIAVEEKDVWQEALENEPWVAPIIDIYETTDDFQAILNMPGVSKENVKLKVEENNLIIMGKINLAEVRERNYVLNESEIGNYYRRLKISDLVDVEKIDATMENGQLKIKLPKHERVKPKNISIK